MSDPFAKNQATSAAEAATISPRAEFRVFGRGVIEVVKQHMWNGKTVLFQARRMPAETYFLSANTNEANVKVRDGLLDIKTKVGETPEGYEIFQPRGKFQFPVKREDLATILSHLKVDLRFDRRQLYDRRVRRDGAPAPRAACRDGREDALRLYHRRHHLRVRRGLVQRRDDRVRLRRERELRRR